MHSKPSPCVFLVLPCYNEEQMLPISAPLLLQKLQNWKQNQIVSSDSRLLFVDDGSQDQTWNLLVSLHQKQPEHVSCLKLSRNRGHQNALWAGLEHATPLCDATISLDVDLQDDIDAMDEMIQAYQEGKEIVYGVRESRETDSAFKRGTAHLFYSLQQKLGAEVVYDHADFRLLGHQALQALLQYDEVHLYLRGLIPLLGFPSATVTYKRQARVAGESKYPLSAMLKLATNGLLDFSGKLLAWILPVACLGLFLTVLSGLWALLALISGSPWSASGYLAWWILFCTSLLLLALGILARYVGRISLELKHRPRYFTETWLHQDGTHE